MFNFQVSHWQLPSPSTLQKYNFKPATLAQTVTLLAQHAQQRLAGAAGDHVTVVLILLGVSIVALALWIFDSSWNLKSSSSRRSGRSSSTTGEKSSKSSSRHVGLNADTKSLPWVGRPDKVARWVLPNTRARLWNMINYEKALKEAYEKYAIHDKACILATLDGEVILLPPSSIPWLISQPEHVVSVNGAHKHILQTSYTFPRPEIMDPTVHFDVIKSELTRQVFNVTPEVCDELAAAVDEIWGTDTDNWTEIPLFDSLTKIIARTSNRVFVGLPFCRNEEYIHNAVGFAEDIALSATLLRLFPAFVRPLVAPIITHPNRKHARAFTRILTPEILRRQQQQQQQQTNNSMTTDQADSKNDFLQWLLTRSLKRSSSTSASNNRVSSTLCPDETDPQIICARLLHTNFAAVHTTSFIATNALLDILSVPLVQGVVDKLRAEAVETMDVDADRDNTLGSAVSGPGPMWSRTSLSRMHYLDSALRETSRRASIIGVGINHKVVAAGGVTTPAGTYLPHGSMVAVHSWGLHNDEKIYNMAGEYRPFRFVELKDKIGRSELQSERRRESENLGSSENEKLGLSESHGSEANAERDEKGEARTHRGGDRDDATKIYLDKAHLQFIATSPTYLGFGHGRHACPGRFFAANELKLLMAYLLTRYDVRMVLDGHEHNGNGGEREDGNGNGLGVRPQCYWAGPNHVPPMGAKVRVRRRKTCVDG
ncbi:Cytochrome P450 monooxygenase [Exophiala dermatitidis]